MTEQQNQEQQNQEQRQRSDAREAGPTIPKHRFDEVSKRAKEAEAQVQKMEAEQSQRDEQQAQAQGEYQKLAEKRGEALKKRDERIKELEDQITHDRRYRAFVGAATGTILPEAFDDAFGMLSNDEWSSVNESDENGVKMLAQGLAERKPYLAATTRGSGSGGSRQPVLGLKSNNDSDRGSKPFQFKNTAKHWK